MPQPFSPKTTLMRPPAVSGLPPAGYTMAGEHGFTNGGDTSLKWMGPSEADLGFTLTQPQSKMFYDSSVHSSRHANLVVVPTQEVKMTGLILLFYLFIYLFIRLYIYMYLFYICL